MDEKKHTYAVEVIFDEVRVNPDATPGQERYVYVNSEVFTFTDDKKEVAKQNAERYFDKTIRYGLTRSAGSIIKSVIPATSIRNIGIIYLNQFKEEQMAMHAEAQASVVPEAPLVPAEVEVVAEPAPVNADVTTN